MNAVERAAVLLSIVPIATAIAEVPAGDPQSHGKVMEQTSPTSDPKKQETTHTFTVLPGTNPTVKDLHVKLPKGHGMPKPKDPNDGSGLELQFPIPVWLRSLGVTKVPAPHGSSHHPGKSW